MTSLAVKGLPSCHLTPWRSGKVNSVPSSFHDQPVARSGITDCMLVCATSCLYMTRSLNTPITGRSAATVDSSRIDMLAGLSKCESLRVPLCFWANAGSADMAISNPLLEQARKRLASPRSTSLNRWSPSQLDPWRNLRPNLATTGTHLLSSRRGRRQFTTDGMKGLG